MDNELGRKFDLEEKAKTFREREVDDGDPNLTNLLIDVYNQAIQDASDEAEDSASIAAIKKLKI